MIDGFVTHKTSTWTLVTDNSTGHLIEDHTGDITSGKTYAPSEILAIADQKHSLIWKSDTDGHDIAILLGSFGEIVEACEIVWIEFDPVGNLSDDRDIGELLSLIGGLSRDVVIFDNYGHLMLRIPARNAPHIVPQLNTWLAIQKSGGQRFVGYFDLWILPSPMADLLLEGAYKVPVT